MRCLPPEQNYPHPEAKWVLEVTGSQSSTRIVTLTKNTLLRATCRGGRVKGKVPQFIHHSVLLLTKTSPTPRAAVLSSDLILSHPVNLYL